MTLKKIDHTFAYDQLSYDATPNRQPSIKLSFFFKKLPEVSDEHFYRHWQSIHSDLTVGTKSFHDNRVQRYVQLHTSPELKKMAEQSGLPTMDYDGCSEIWVRDFKDWVNFANSEEFQTALMGDADTMGMQLPFVVYPSVENVIFGQGLETLGGKAGITEDTPRAQQGHHRADSFIRGVDHQEGPATSVV